MKMHVGISYLISIILMTLIVVALGTLLYAYFSGWIGTKTGSATGPESVLIIDKAYVKGTRFIIFVRNSGINNVTIDKAYITAPNGTVYPKTLNKIVPAGEVQRISINLRGTLSSGIWIIELRSNDGSSTSISVRV